MFTTGFKFFFGLTIALTIGAVAYGYSTGGEHVGPVTLGWKGGVGDHVGYLVLIGGAFASACFAGIIVAFRDADPAAQSHYMGVEAIAPTTPVTGSFWPVVGAFGGAAMVPGGVEVPRCSMALGVPAKIREGVLDEFHARMNVEAYTARSAQFRDELRRLD